MLTLAVKIGLTVIVMAFDVAGEPVKHGLAFDVITTETTSEFDNDIEVKVEAVSPETLVPFNCHWYAGVEPPFVGVAVKVTLVPEQIVLADALMFTLAGKFGLTII